MRLLLVIMAGTEKVMLLRDVLTALTRLLLEILNAPAFFGKQAKKSDSLSAYIKIKVRV
jgi:hypothetical protein